MLLPPVSCKRTNPFRAHQGLSAGEMQNHFMSVSVRDGMLARTKPLLATEFFPLRSFQEVNLSQEMLRLERKDRE